MKYFVRGNSDWWIELINNIKIRLISTNKKECNTVVVSNNAISCSIYDIHMSAGVDVEW